MPDGNGGETQESRRETIQRAVDEQRTRNSPPVQVPIKISDIWEAADKAVLGLFEVLALLFALPFGDDLYNDRAATAWHVAYLVFGCFLAIGGPMFPLIRKWPGLSNRLASTAREPRTWIAILPLFFVYNAAPEIYQRATSSPKRPPSAAEIAEAVVHILPRNVSGAGITVPAQTVPVIQPPPAASLTSEQVQLRTALRAFALYRIKILWSLESSLADDMMGRYNGINHNNSSPANQLFSESIAGSIEPSYDRLINPLVNSRIDNIDPNQVMEDIFQFFNSYYKMQALIEDYGQVSGVAPNNDHNQLLNWKAEDEKSLAALRELRTYPDAKSLARIGDGQFISENHKFDKYLPSP